MIENQRHCFDIPEDIIYLDSASNAPLLNSVRQAGEFGLDRKYHPWEIDRDAFVREGETVRGLFASLIGAEVGDIAVVPSTAYGIATAAQNLPIARGQNIVVIEDQFPSNVYAWMELAAANDAMVLTAARPDDDNWTTAVLETINAKTAIVTVPPCHWTDGSSLDLVAIGSRCREVGAAYVIDSTQATGACPMDVSAIQPDFIACAGYKWLMCPYSLGFLYAAPHRQSGRPLESHGLNHKAEAPGGTISYIADYSDGGRRYDMGQRFSFINIPMAIAGMSQLLEWRVSEIHETLSALIDHTAELANRIGWKVPDPRYRIGHFIGITPPAPLPDDIIARLNQENIYLSKRGSGLRISPHLHNSPADIDRVFDFLGSL